MCSYLNTKYHIYHTYYEDTMHRECLEEQVDLTDQASRDSRASPAGGGILFQEPLRMCATCRTQEPRCWRAVLEPACT